MNLCLRFVTSTMMGLDLAVLMTAALLCLPVASADEGEGGGGTSTTVECTRDCDCDLLPLTREGEACNSFGPAFCLDKGQCFCIRNGGGLMCINQ
ncbi:hypothetical protein Spb1_02050 [Planctopirus ephydatiae]|uniref:Uncharacterized protein n=1 Tax=Planctopirus ephydatiae TaxID=2528019 RepID=A0A518GID4_9PLAN|nr:hypothetical protein Spb1_02050 [Planctopirus ephydatiae]